VDYPDADSAGQRHVKNLVRDDTINYIRVPWTNQESLPNDASVCDALLSCYSVDDGCVCDTTTVESVAYVTVGSIGSKDDILGTLRIGAVDPTSFDTGVYTSIGECISGVQVYSKTSLKCGDPLGMDAIFQLTDANGIMRFFKNLISTVHVSSTSASFRNPVHFIDFMNRNLRDMFQETDAVLDSYFYHPSHAPFMALRFLQRFGISNPSPGYVKRVSTAYKIGSYGQFGSGKYGDLGAMVAALLLDDESRQVVLDADQSHGQLREPLLKVFGLLRAMKAGKWAPLSVPLLYHRIVDQIGQSPYLSPSVFSFFKPEFKTGAVLEAGLVAPEAEVLKGGLITSLVWQYLLFLHLFILVFITVSNTQYLNAISHSSYFFTVPYQLDGMWSTMKFGLSHCYGGFQERGWGVGCGKREGVSMADATATLSYEADSTASIDEVLSELGGFSYLLDEFLWNSLLFNNLSHHS